MKKLSILIIIFVVLFLAFYKSKTIRLDGRWNAEKVLFNGKEIYEKTSKNIPFTVPNLPVNVNIDNHAESISIQHIEDTITGSFKIHYEEKKPYAIIKSKNALLNGRFDIKIDTFYGEHSYSVNVELQSKSTYLQLSKNGFLATPQQAFIPHQKGRP